MYVPCPGMGQNDLQLFLVAKKTIDTDYDSLTLFLLSILPPQTSSSRQVQELFHLVARCAERCLREASKFGEVSNPRSLSCNHIAAVLSSPRPSQSSDLVPPSTCETFIMSSSARYLAVKKWVIMCKSRIQMRLIHDLDLNVL